jgi:hypothetical protein
MKLTEAEQARRLLDKEARDRQIEEERMRKKMDSRMQIKEEKDIVLKLRSEME